MDHMRTLGLLDKNGKPLAAGIVRMVTDLLPRLRREFPALQDELALSEVAERQDAGSRTVRHAPARSRTFMGTCGSRCAASPRRTCGAGRSNANYNRVDSVPAERGSPEQIERDILLRQLLAKLSPEEQRVIAWKLAGFSSREIAEFENRTAVAVDTIFCRAKQRVRALMDNTPQPAERPAPQRGVNGRAGGSALPRQEDTETPDGTTRSALGR